MTPASVLDAVLALLPVGVAVGDDRDRRLRAGCRGLRERRGEGPRVGVDDRLEVGGGLLGGVDRVDGTACTVPSGIRALPVAVEEVAALPVVRSRVRVSPGGRSGCHGVPCAGWRPPRRHRTPRPRWARCTTRSRRPAGSSSRPGPRMPCRRHAGVTGGHHDGGLAEVLDDVGEGVTGRVVGERDGADVLGGPRRGEGRDGGACRGIPVGLLLAPPERAAGPRASTRRAATTSAIRDFMPPVNYAVPARTVLRAWSGRSAHEGSGDQRGCLPMAPRVSWNHGGGGGGSQRYPLLRRCLDRLPASPALRRQKDPGRRLPGPSVGGGGGI